MSCYYGIVAGVKPTSVLNKFYKNDPVLWCRFFLNEDDTDEVVALDVFPGMAYENFWSIIKEKIKETGDFLVTFHDALKDDQCKFHGLHIHAMVNFQTHPTRDSRWGRKLIDWSKSTDHYFSAQKVSKFPNLKRHILTPPRRFLWSYGENFSDYADIIKEQNDVYNQRMIEDTSVKVDVVIDAMNEKGEELKESKEGSKIRCLLRMFNKYRCCDMSSLKGNVIRDKNEWKLLQTLMSYPSYECCLKKAQEIYKCTLCHMKLEKRLSRGNSDWLDGDEFLSVTESHDVLDKWFKCHNLKKDQFMRHLLDVLTQRRKKKNSFWIVGPPNAGKSFVLRSLLPWYEFYGEVRGGGTYTFMFQDCLDVGLIFVEEPMIGREVVEQFKLIMEGQETHVNVKMRPSALVKPTPVIMTSNSNLWHFVPGEADALRARCFEYRLYGAADFLKDVTKMLNPLIWVDLFRKYVVDSKYPIIDRFLKGFWFESDEETQKRAIDDVVDDDASGSKIRKLDGPTFSDLLEESSNEIGDLTPEEVVSLVEEFSKDFD